MTDFALEPNLLEDSSSSNSSLDTTVSRMIADENIIDSFFFICDVDKQGTVAVSKLIEFIINTTDGNIQGEGDVELLRKKLDPDGRDVEVDLELCRRGVAEWIQDIRCRNLASDNSSFSDEDDVPTPSYFISKETSMFTSSPEQNGRLPLTIHRRKTEPCFNHLHLLNDDMEVSDLSGLVSDLQLQNKRLAEENTKLREQLTSNEEISSSTILELDDLRNTVKNFQQQVEKLKETQLENLELKTALSSSEEMRLSLEDKMQHMTKEKTCLESHISDIQKQLLEGMTQLEQSEKCQQELQSELIEQKKHRLAVLEEKESFESMLLEKTQQFEQLQSMSQELNSICEVLKQERTDVQMQLEETQQKLIEAERHVERLDSSTSFASATPESEQSDGEELMPVKLTTTSTPATTPSLCNELKKTLRKEHSLPTPICSKEMEEVIRKRTVDESVCSSDFGSMSPCVRSIKEERDLVARQLSELALLSPDGAYSRELLEGHDPQFKSVKLEDEVSSFADKISILISEKQDMQTRVMKLEESLQQASEMNDVLQQKYKSSKDILEDSFGGNLDDKILEKIQQLQCQLANDVERRRKIEYELHEKESAFEELRSETSTLRKGLAILEEEKVVLNGKVKEFESANAELLEKYEKSEHHAKNLKDELGKKRERDKSLEHEESTRAQTLKQQLDLKELFRIVQKDVEAECMSDGQETPITASTESVRESVAKEIKKLRSKLARSQAAFAILHSKTISPGKGNKKLTRHHSPSSPLVEALTLDLFEGYQQEKNPAGKKREGCASADSILDGHDGDDLDASFQLDALLAKSCPHLSNRLISSSTQTEENSAAQKRRAPQIGATRYTSVNTSTGSSTSGVVDLDFSSSSNKSEPHGIFSLPRKSVLIVETTCSPDTPSSPDDPNDPLLRHRTSSFKRAIERGPSGDSNQSVETCDPASTSPEDLTPDRPDLPPYPYPPPITKDRTHHHHSGTAAHNKDYQHTVSSEYTHSYGSHLNIPDYDPCISHFTHSVTSDSTSASVTHKQSALDPTSSISHCDTSHSDKSAVKDVYFVEDLHSRFKGLVSAEQNSSDVHDVNASGVVNSESNTNDVKHSPRTSRRLSTLVEEGSDAEAEESILQAHMHRTGRMLPPPKPPKPSQPNRKAPKLLEAPLSPYQQQQYCEPSTSPKTTPPTYRSPPAYGDAVKRDTSPARTPGSQDRSRSPSPRPSTVNLQSKSSVTVTVLTKPETPPKTPIKPTPPVGVLHRYVAPQVRPVGLALDTQRDQNVVSTCRAEIQQPHVSPAALSPRTTTVTTAEVHHHKPEKEGASNGGLNEGELSEADKLFTAQLLEEARKVTVQSKHRGKLSKRRSGSDLTRSQTFDDGDDEVFVDKVAAGKGPQSPGDSEARSPTQQRPHELSIFKWSLNLVKDSSEGEYELKKDSVQGLSKSDQNANKPFRISPNVHLEKLREENLAKKRNQSKQGNKMPDLSETSETESGKASGASAEEGENGGPPSAFPSLSNRILSSMGLEHKKGDPLPDAEQMSDADVEEKFISLALAFKTDKMTLEKRIELHERSRDIAEQNVDKELEGLNEALKALSPFCNDATSRDVYNKIKHHVDVLEQSTVRVSSRAEVHGAVQQELRMSKAIDVMVQHVENLKRMYEREHHELEETRKLVHDNRLGGDDLSKRSYSVVGPGLKLGGRRRSSAAVVLPRRMSMVSTNSSTSTIPTLPDLPTLDPKTRFLTTTTDTSLKTPVASSEKPSLTSTPNHSTLSNGNEKSDITLKGDVQLDTNRNIDQELIFQKGFEEGVRAQVSQEIDQLRQQQQSFSDSIDQLLDENDIADDDEDDVETLLDKMWRWWPAFEKSGQRVRFALATLVFLMAFFSILFTLVPVGSATAVHNNKPTYSPWYSFQEILQPHISLRYKEGTPPS